MMHRCTQLCTGLYMRDRVCGCVGGGGSFRGLARALRGRFVFSRVVPTACALCLTAQAQQNAYRNRNARGASHQPRTSGRMQPVLDERPLPTVDRVQRRERQCFHRPEFFRRQRFAADVPLLPLRITGHHLKMPLE